MSEAETPKRSRVRAVLEVLAVVFFLHWCLALVGSEFVGAFWPLKSRENVPLPSSGGLLEP